MPSNHPTTWHVPLTWMSRALQSVLRRCAELQLERLTVQSLSDMNDHQLADIGLTRGEIRSAVQAGSLADRITTTCAPQRPRHEAVPPTRSVASCGSAS
jgi:uncharacterized protein YjiS (DUF1127 family)